MTKRNRYAVALVNLTHDEALLLLRLLSGEHAQALYGRGYRAGLRRAIKHLDEAWNRDIAFMEKYPDAPRWQYLSAKYGALQLEPMIIGLRSQIKKLKTRSRRDSKP